MTPESPDGINLHPESPSVARISKRALMGVFLLGLAILGVLFYGMAKRRQSNEQEQAERAAAVKIEAATPEGVISPNPPPPQPTQPPAFQQPEFNGYQPSPQMQVYDRQIQPAVPPPVKKEPTPEEITAARTREAMLSPMTVAKQDAAHSQAPAVNVPVAAQPPVLAQGEAAGPQMDEYAQVNMQRTKETFLAAARAKASGNYLQYTRTRQLAPCEIKAGWEIPAVLEQNINSDLPGEIKALVSQNIYDTASGKFLLIPQGSRLLGKYNSEVGYGQEAAQVVWERIIYPDGSSLNLAGMVGLDSEGNAGFREKVDRHYKRTFGMAFLTSAFVAAYELTNRRQYGGVNGVYAQPTAADRATGAMAGEMANTAAAVTRKNLNVQPTIRVNAGYRFTVRVNRDMLFESPYQPDTPQPEETTQPLRKASR